MTDSTTIAVILKRVFNEFNDRISANNQGTTFDVWTAMFGGDGRSEFDVMESVGLIYSLCTRLRGQVVTSLTLDKSESDAALNIIRNLEHCLSIGNLLKAPGALSRNCNSTVLGNLGILARALQHEFAEPKLSNAEVAKLISALREIREHLKSSELAVDLCIKLMKQIDSMIWWLEHSDMIGVQELFEQAVAAALIVEQVGECLAEKSANKAQLFQVIKERSSFIFGTLVRAVGFCVKNADKVEKLGATYRALLGGPTGG